MVSILFGDPVYLWFLLSIPLLVMSHFLFLRVAQNKAMRFANFEALKRIDGKRYLVKNYVILLFRVLALLCLILALADTTAYYPGQRSDFDYVLAIDVSPSMITEDIEPNRLDAAKTHAITFLNTLDARTEVGVVSFSGITNIRQPLTENLLDARLNINVLNISRVSGTDVAGAIVAGSNLLINSGRGKAIILFTDGVDTAGAYLDDSVTQAVSYALENDVVIHTVGYGTDGALIGYLPQIYNLTSVVDQETLTFIAEQTGGQAFFPTTNQESDLFFSTLASQASNAQVPYRLRTWGLIFTFLFLAIEWVVLNVRFRRIA